MYWILVSLALFVSAISVVRLAWLIPMLRVEDSTAVRKAFVQEERSRQLMVFLGSGGHTGEMLRLLDSYINVLHTKGKPICAAYSDADSRNKFKHWLKTCAVTREVIFMPLIKAREVGSSGLQSILTVVQSLMHSFRVVRKTSELFGPDPVIVLLNGPGTCCVLVFWLRFIEFFTFRNTKIVYVESLARTETLSLTGRILYPFVDEFVVQWPELVARYKRAKYYGILV